MQNLFTIPGVKMPYGSIKTAQISSRHTVPTSYMVVQKPQTSKSIKMPTQLHKPQMSINATHKPQARNFGTTPHMTMPGKTLFKPAQVPSNIRMSLVQQDSTRVKHWALGCGKAFDNTSMYGPNHMIPYIEQNKPQNWNNPHKPKMSAASGRKGVQMNSSKAESSDSTQILEEYDPTQVEQMKDSVALVSEQDEIIGPVSKFDAHLRKNLENKENPLKPHRAFSLFLFNSKNELLLQQRSDEKITFPGMWTNTCCSHPRYLPEELDPEDLKGIKKAVVRRSDFELGIKDLKEEDLKVGARILYYANGCDKFAEYELDYIVFAKTNVEHEFNSDEIQATKYVSIDEIEEFLKDKTITPWFKLLMNRSLMPWWRNIIDNGFEKGCPDEFDNIVKF